MKILALEFSSDERSVAVAELQGAKVIMHGTARERGGRDTKAFAMIQSALGKIPRASIDCIAVGLGPGSYTGIRIAISVAQGWQLATRVKLLGLSSAECVAHHACEMGLSGEVNVVIDAQRNEFYAALYRIEPEAVKLLDPLQIVAADEIQKRLASGQTVIGPDIASRHPGAINVVPDARILAQLAANRTDFIKGEQLEPIYLRAISFVKAPAPREV